MSSLVILCACKTVKACCCKAVVEEVCPHAFNWVSLSIVGTVFIIGVTYLVSKWISYHFEYKMLKFSRKK